MRMSCNGCRVLRKGCSDDCSIRPCLQWINNPESQANATVFLAKFYGRAGLINLLNATGPHNLRPAIFRSLLYEACGRIVNPIYGSVGLLWSGKWQTCQAAVEDVLDGKPIVQIPSSDHTPPPPFSAGYDIRHVASSADLHKVANTTRTRFKKSSSSSARHAAKASRSDRGAKISHDSSSENELSSSFSEETAEASHVSQAAEPSGREESGVELELTLGFEPARPAVRAEPEPEPKRVEMDGWNYYTCKVELGLELRN